jgi:predicted sulfurtransferase
MNLGKFAKIIRMKNTILVLMFFVTILQAFGQKKIDQKSFVSFMKDDNTVVLDVRTPEEFMGGHVAGSINIPLQEIPDRLEELKSISDKIIQAFDKCLESIKCIECENDDKCNEQNGGNNIIHKVMYFQEQLNEIYGSINVSSIE